MQQLALIFALILNVFFPLIANAQVKDQVGGIYTPGFFSTVNFVKNPSCAANVRNITASGGSLTQTTSSPVSGSASCAVDASSSGQTYKWSTRTFDNGLNGQNCEAKFTYTGDGSLYKAYVEQPSGTRVSAEVEMLDAGANGRPVSIPYPCGSNSSATEVVIESTSASAAAIKVGDVYAGSLTNLSLANAWETSYVRYQAVTGRGSTDTFIIQWTTQSSLVDPHNAFTITSNATTGTSIRINRDGTLWTCASINGGNSTERYLTRNQATRTAAPTANETLAMYNISINESGVNNICWQGPVSAGDIIRTAADAAPASSIGNNWQVLFVPAGPRTALRPDQVAWRVDANISGANPSLGTSAVSSYTEITDAGLTLTQNTGSISTGIACSSTNASTVGSTTCSAGNEGIGITFNAPTSGDVLACVSFGHAITTSTTGQVASTFQIVETPSNAQTISQEGKSRVSSGMLTASVQVQHPLRVCGNFTFSSAGQKTLRLMYEQGTVATVSSNVIIGDAAANNGQRDIHWEVYPLNYYQPAPLLVNTVVAPDYTGVTRINTVTTKSVDYTATETDETIILDTSSANRTLTLPAASNLPGKKFIIRMSSDSNLGIITPSSGTVCGQSSIRLSGIGDAVEIQSDGSNWIGLANTCIASRSALVASTGTITYRSGGAWFSSCGNTATKACTYRTNIWSATPSCVGTTMSASGRLFALTAESSSSFTTRTFDDTGTNSNIDFNVVCVGPR